MITISILQTLCPSTHYATLEEYVDPLNTVGEYYDLFVNKYRISGFLAQIIHESGGFNITIENLNYSATGLRNTFPKYFPTDNIAAQYARQPQKIANKVYANRMKNGDELSGDGWLFRGRGLIQITGRENYTNLATALEMSIPDCIAYLETNAGATASAGWFWDINKLNTLCDAKDIDGVSKRVNGGKIGLQERAKIYQAALGVV